MSTTVIVDDTDPAIHYIGNWTLGGPVTASSNEFNRTVHIASENGLGFTYEFKGSRISVYATLDSPSSNGIPSAIYSLDSFAPTVANGPDMSAISDLQSHLLLYQSPPLVDGRHTLNVSLSNMTSGPKFYFDFITIDVASAEPLSHIIVDDQSSDIKYSGNWTDSHSFNEYLGTDRLAAATNATASFEFTGQAIKVYGTITANNDPQSIIDFSIDAGEATRYNAPFSPIQRHTLLYSVSGLSSGTHNLTFKTRNSTPWWFDYIVYTLGSEGSSSSNTNSDANTSPTVTSTSPGAIAGGVIGGVAGLAILVLLFFLIRRRRKRKLSRAVVTESKQFQSSPTVPSTGNTRGFLDDTSYTATSPEEPAVGGGMIYGDRKGRPPAPPNRVSTVASESVPSTLALSALPLPPRREVDGGVRLAGSSDYGSDLAPSTLPPSYDRY